MQKLPKNPTEADLEIAYANGLLRKDALVHGAYYEGTCRNARVARWHARAQCFVHWRVKCGFRFLETIKHPADEPHFDVFMVCAHLAEPGAEVIPDEDFEAYAAKRG